MSRQWRSDDTNTWGEAFGTMVKGNLTVASNQEWRVANGVSFTTDGNTFGSLTGTSGNYTASVTDRWGFNTNYANPGDIVLIHQTRGTGEGNWELNVVVSGVPASGGSETLTLKYPLQNTYAAGAQIIGCYHYNNITVNSGITLSAYTWDNTNAFGGIVFMFAGGTVTITGSISGSSRGHAGGALVSGDSVGWQGSGTGSGAQSQAANGCGGGGGQRHNPGVYNPSGGGGGGHAAAGANPTNKTNSGSGTVGGSAVGNAGLTSMFMGGGGGAGGGKSGGGNSGAGGAGGAIVFIVAKTITITGSIASGGANGSAPTNTSDAGGDGGGGGAGGSVLLKGEAVTVGTNLITVAAGAGNTSGSHSNAGNGAVGRIHVDYSTSFSGSASPAIDSRQDLTIVGLVPTTNYLRRYRRTRLPGGITGV